MVMTHINGFVVVNKCGEQATAVNDQATALTTCYGFVNRNLQRIIT